ncbi:hypothetical protein C942_02220 [Photobacterium marinum]|uniref:Uncharacterized protein n=1 Tax=Photobacterium marinum TaxID=1056511 RepID=L8JAS3_9GAMM|nr:hypothetical protein [Photobacterium marinum]ELR64649.1 hypothetical protein C942_02220 [Photobacterium marinum]
MLEDFNKTAEELFKDLSEGAVAGVVLNKDGEIGILYGNEVDTTNSPKVAAILMDAIAKLQAAMTDADK